MSLRPVRQMYKSTPTMEGAGVKLRRAFGFGKTEDFDPFLLLDDFRGDRKDDYIAGFPWHPHRGIETITYVLAGTVEHKDSLGNSGELTGGDVQWMTAGSGIIHQEMPRGDGDGRMHGFQLWANLPSSLKMTAPHYQDRSAADVPEVTDDDGTTARIICGNLWGKDGAVDGIAASPNYFDISVPPGRSKTIKVDVARSAFAYVFAGDGVFADSSEPRAVATDYTATASAHHGETADNRTLVLFDRGDEIRVAAGESGIRFLLVSGEPIREPVAWQGPIVMNTQEELRVATEEFRNGTFLKHTGVFK
jgi:quercetin 2,3-dioxygenase